jgi:hypothetical protein
MAKLNLAKVGNTIVAGVKRHHPEILITMGVTGLVSAGIMGVRATPKALALIEEEKENINHALYDRAMETGEEYEPVEKLLPKDVVKLTWKCYIPAVTTGVISIACIVGGTSANMRRNAALATAYTLSETAFKEYKDKVVETIGEKKEKEVQEEVHKDMLKKNPVASKEIIVTNTAEARCYDAWSGRYFMSDRNTLDRIVNELNEEMISSFNPCVSLNEFYYKLGLPEVKIGDYIGWRIDGDRRLLKLNITSTLAPEDGMPCMVVDFATRPEYGFDEIH